MKLQRKIQPMEIQDSCTFHKLIIFIFIRILDTTNMFKTCDYLYLKNEIHFAKPLKMFDPRAERKLKAQK